jgi:colanic acid biosynthesis glycosyl transferase WcaI
VTRVVVIGRDMARLAYHKGADPRTLEIITNWADLNEITPTRRDANPVLRKLGLTDHFVVQYCGNMGLTHGLDDLLQAANALRDQPDIHLLMIGSGARYEWLQRAVGDGRLTNISVLPRCPRSQLNDYLNACDIAVVSLMPGMSGVSVPSRMYNIMAAGKPILAIADEDSELALTVREEGIGWVVAPGDQPGIVTVIRAAEANPAQLQTMGWRARQVAQEKFSQERIAGQYRELFASL